MSQIPPPPSTPPPPPGMPPPPGWGQGNSGQGWQQPAGPKPPSYLVWAILTTLFCCLPFGIVISNLIGRMVLEEFVGITPDVAIDWRVLVGSAD